MNWKEKVYILEQNHDFDVAIFFMRQIIQEYAEDVDAYICLHFFRFDVHHVSRRPMPLFFKTLSKIKSERY